MVCTHQEVEWIKFTKEKLTAFAFSPACIPCVGISVFVVAHLTHQYDITGTGHFIIVSLSFYFTITKRASLFH